MVILSGPEPQRTILEEHLLNEVERFKGNVLFIKGKIEESQKIIKNGSITIYNFMNSKELEIAFNESELILCRSGYTTVMDLTKLEKMAFFIPTPGQYEQEYLAKKLEKHKLVPFSKQEKFKIEMLKNIDDYIGLNDFKSEINYTELFNLFHSK